VTPEEREAAARPQNAGDYREPFNASRAAPLLWSDDVAEIDGLCRDKSNKKDIGKRTGAINKWFKGLPANKIEEAENAADKWNSLGCPDKNKMHM
jgi:hypothetical protein